jgi:HEAT repeat protein
VEALGSLVGSDAPIRQLIVAKLDETRPHVQWVAVEALGSLVGSDATIRQLIVAKLDDGDNEVRQAAVQALGSLVGSDATVQQAILAKLDDTWFDVQGEVVQALGSLVGSDATIRQAIVAKLDDVQFDARFHVQWTAVQALGSLVGSDATIRQFIVAKLDDMQPHVQWAAVQALGSLVSSDTTIRQLIVTKLDDAQFHVRQAAVEALASLVGSDTEITQRLLPWLGTISQHSVGYGDTTQRRLADAYALVLANHPELLRRVADMLTAPAWPTRQGAAWTLLAMPGGVPPHLLPRIHGLFEDMRSEGSWSRRLSVAELLLNNHEKGSSQRAIAVALEALDFATQPWYDLPFTGSRVREEAARILGRLELLSRDKAVFARLTRVLEEDTEAPVRDAAYSALLRLAVPPEEGLS